MKKVDKERKKNQYECVISGLLLWIMRAYFLWGGVPLRTYLDLASGSSYRRTGRLGHTSTFFHVPVAKHYSLVLILLQIFVVPVEVKQTPEGLKTVLRQKKKKTPSEDRKLSVC